MFGPLAVLMNPATIDLDLKDRRQQARERPIEAVIDRIASIDRTIKDGKIRHDSLVGDGWIVKRKGADEEAISRNTVCVYRMR